LHGCKIQPVYEAISLARKFDKFRDVFRPKVIAELNDYQFKLARVKGEFVWHRHADTDEAFLVIDGELRIDFRDGHVTLGPGEMFVVPKGKEHKPFAVSECKIMLIEPRGVVNTGDATGELTAPLDAWI
jgi:mannose-6-phosphate isomerase-like protein (cupin superfamily)